MYEDILADNKLCANFFAHFGVDVHDLPDVGVVRRSLSARETMLKMFLNQGITSSRQNKDVLAWMQTSQVRNLLDRHFGPEEFDLWESRTARQKFLAVHEKDNDKILQRYFPERTTLFPPLEEKVKPKVPSLPEACKAEMVFCDVCREAGCASRSGSYAARWRRLVQRMLQASGIKA